MDIVRDPVCGELIHWQNARGVLSFRGNFYYFCCYGCLQAFRHSPSQYIK